MFYQKAAEHDALSLLSNAFSGLFAMTGKEMHQPDASACKTNWGRMLCMRPDLASPARNNRNNKNNCAASARQHGTTPCDDIQTLKCRHVPAQVPQQNSRILWIACSKRTLLCALPGR